MLFKNKKDVVFLTPQTIMEDTLYLSTNEKRFWNAYIVKEKDVKKIEDGNTFLAEIPEKSNIKNIEKHIKKYIKGMKNHSEYQSYDDDGEFKIVWVDGYNRHIASISENDDGLYYDIRADVASHIINHDGLHIIQCNAKVCDYIKPQILKIDLNKKKL